MIVLLFGNGQNLDLQNTVPRLRFDIVLPLLWPGMISLVSALPGAASYHKTRLPLEGGDVFVRPAVKCRKIARMGQRRSTRQPPAILTSYAGWVPATDAGREALKVACGAHADSTLFEIAQGKLGVPDFLTDLLDIDFGSPVQVLQYLLHHPGVTLVVSVVAYFVVPRMISFTTRTLLSLGIVFLLFQAVQNHDGFLPLIIDTIREALQAALDHPITTSAIILAMLALALSPYLILGLAVLVVVSGVQLMPPQLKQMLPQPFRQAEDAVESMQVTVKKPVQEVKEQLGSTRKRVENKLQAAKQAILGPLDQVKDATGSAVDKIEKTVSRMERGLEDMTGCTRLETPELRAACVREKNAR